VIYAWRFLSIRELQRQYFQSKQKNCHQAGLVVILFLLLTFEKSTSSCRYSSSIRASRPDQARRPLTMAPFVPGSYDFDVTPFDGKAVILWTDNSVTSVPIDRTTLRVLVDGQDLLDPHHPI
jgi:hypothetical protein